MRTARKVTSPETLAELRARTLARECPACLSDAGRPCRKVSDPNPGTLAVHFHEARYGPVRDAWNARREVVLPEITPGAETLRHWFVQPGILSTAEIGRAHLHLAPDASA